MRCAQSGCEISADMLIENGIVPELCPTCGHPLAFVLTRLETAEALGLPLEEDMVKTTQLPLEEGGPQED
jgi:hypothetical protein